MLNKFVYISVSICTLFTLNSSAQSSGGGIPLKLKENPSDYVPVKVYTAPSWDSASVSWQRKIENGAQLPLLIGLMANVDVSFPESGVFFNENGKRIWKSTINITNAPAIGLYFDQFNLPKGVNFYVYNQNRNQILGAFTNNNNDKGGVFAIDALEGQYANLEIDMDENVSVNDIKFHINQAGAYYNSISHLLQYKYVGATSDNFTPFDYYDTALANGSSVCMINAICPLSNHYEIQRNATVQVIQPEGQSIGLCSGTMVNNSGNVGGVCNKYVLYASHCDGGTSIANSHFSQTIFRFNYQQDDCYLTVAPEHTNSIVGANFLARSILQLGSDGEPVTDQIKGDFLLLSIRYPNTLLSSWGVNMLGWKSNENIQTSGYSYPKKFIEFHHPGGDMKKVTSYNSISSTGLSSDVNNSHWLGTADSGYIAQGSSGSGLLDGDGKIIGVASVGYFGSLPANCNYSPTGINVSTKTSKVLAFSKVSYDWDYAIDGDDDKYRLRPWLDPTGSGVNTIAPVTSSCETFTDTTGGNYITGIYNTPNELGYAFDVFPNPSTTGNATLRLNLKDKTNILVQVLDIMGRKIQSFNLNNVQSGTYNLQLSNCANGMYIVQLSDGNVTSSKKLILSK